MKAEPGSLLAKYEAEVARLEGLKVTLQVEEGRLKWLVVGGIVGGAVVGALAGALYGVLLFALGVVMAGTGLYLTRVHTMERDYNLDRARKEVARLRAEAAQAAARAAEEPPPEAAPGVGEPPSASP